MSQTLDVTGLLPEQVDAIQAMVNGYRRQNEAGSNGPPPGETAEEWSRRFRAWVESHPKRDIEFDDSRESIYEGCGE